MYVNISYYSKRFLVLEVVEFYSVNLRDIQMSSLLQT